MSRVRQRRRFAVDLRSSAAARRWVVEVLRLQKVAAEEVAVLVSELVSNALQHAGLADDEQIVVLAEREGSVVRVEVQDNGGRFAKTSASPHRRDGGRGLQIIEALSRSWGVSHNGHTHVWFTYALSQTA